MKKVSVVGLGKLGSPIMAVFASKNYEVIGIDKNPEYVDKINSGIAPVQEPQLQEFITSHKANIRATTNYEEAVATTDVTMVIVPTPSGNDGTFMNDYLVQSMEEIGKALSKKNGYHLVVIKSTVMPGSTAGEIQNTLETASGRIVGDNLGLCYSPEFIALGNVIHNLLYPDLVLIGESDQKAGDMLEKIYCSTCNNQPTIRRMNFINAEIAKISINTYVTTKISYANMLSDVCQRFEGADVDEVTAAVGVDSRIGKKYLRAGVAFGGPCFPRDNIAFGAMANKIGARADIAFATQEINKYQNQRLQLLLQQTTSSNQIAILGLAYKAGTSVVEESQSIELANQLAEKGCRVTVHDPLAMIEARKVLRQDIQIAETIETCLDSSETIIIMTPCPEFSKGITPIQVRGKTVIDCWRLLPRTEFQEFCDLLYLGFGTQHEPLAVRN